jgi:uncharacterized repeat protein (TIGR02543 family)
MNALAGVFAKQKLLCLITAWMLLLSNCFTDWRGEGTLTINLGGGSGRSILPWVPEKHNEILNGIKYNIEITHPGEQPIIIKDKKHGETIRAANIAPGTWTVDVKAYYYGNYDNENYEKALYAEGSKPAPVKAGINNTVTVEMTKVDYWTVSFVIVEADEVNKQIVRKGSKADKPKNPTQTGYKCKFVGWYEEEGKNPFNFNTPITKDITLYAQWQPYAIGDTGPGGGIIFYRNVNSFNLYDINPDNKKICHYLEAAPADETGTYIWGDLKVVNSVTTILDYPIPTPIELKECLGYGKRDTQLIVAHMNEESIMNTAAQQCSNKTLNGFSDWFLPSIGELIELYDQWDLPGLNFYLTNTNLHYWSSTQIDYTDAWVRVFRNPASGDMSLNNLKNKLNLVRAIRAF